MAELAVSFPPGQGCAVASGVDKPWAQRDMAPVAWHTRGTLGRCWRELWDGANGNLQPLQGQSQHEIGTRLQQNFLWCSGPAAHQLQPREGSCVDQLQVMAVTPG